VACLFLLVVILSKPFAGLLASFVFLLPGSASTTIICPLVSVTPEPRKGFFILLLFSSLLFCLPLSVLLSLCSSLNIVQKLLLIRGPTFSFFEWLRPSVPP
jgi:hypothetical protein